MRRLRLGMVGGGQGAFIGAVHRIAARIDDCYELVAGALSSDAERARASGAELGLAPERVYADFEEMARAEAARDDGIEVCAIVTPNHLHFAPAKAMLEAGIHVICDKPLTSKLDDANTLTEVVARSGCHFFLTHNYTGYPLVREARRLVADGALGALRVVQVEYAQDWLSTKLEDSGQKQASWRTDPARAGAGGALGDIGTHAHNLACFVTGQSVDELCAEVSTFVDGRPLDDDAQVLLRFDGGARGTLWCSQVAVGNENTLRLRVYGDNGGLEWAQENPNELILTTLGETRRIATRGGPGLGAEAEHATRIPPGHPEGYLEGFANIYRDAANVILGTGSADLLPGIEAGLAGMRFVDACVASARSGGRWTRPTAGRGRV